MGAPFLAILGDHRTGTLCSAIMTPNPSSFRSPTHAPAQAKLPTTPNGAGVDPAWLFCCCHNICHQFLELLFLSTNLLVVLAVDQFSTSTSRKPLWPVSCSAFPPLRGGKRNSQPTSLLGAAWSSLNPPPHFNCRFYAFEKLAHPLYGGVSFFFDFFEACALAYLAGLQVGRVFERLL